MWDLSLDVSFGRGYSYGCDDTRLDEKGRALPSHLLLGKKVKRINIYTHTKTNLARVLIGTFSFWPFSHSHSFAWAEGKRDENECRFFIYDPERWITRLVDR